MAVKGLKQTCRNQSQYEIGSRFCKYFFAFPQILLQFEALTGHSPKGEAFQHALLPAPPQRSPLDLLNDIVPQSEEETLLAPSHVPPSPSSELTHGNCSTSKEGQVMDPETSAPDQDSGPHLNGVHGCPSLFDGMDLVTPVRSGAKTKPALERSVTKLHTDSVLQQRTAQPCLPSAFSFLNT